MMFEYLGLTAILKHRNTARLMRIPLRQELQDQINIDWFSQYSSFVSTSTEIEFDPGYRPEGDEVFVLEDFQAPGWLSGESARSMVDLDPITEASESMHSICGIVAFVMDRTGKELHLFQNFSKSRVIEPRRALFIDGKHYTASDYRVVTLSGDLAAVHRPDDRKLLFRDFRTTNSFLPLSDFYREASEEEIRGVLEHDLLAVEDANALAEEANQWFRKRFAMLRHSGLLDRVSATDLQNRAKGYPVRLDVVGDKVVFPADRLAAKRLLQFLNEEIFRGAITETVYETNSKKRAAS